MRYDFMIPVLRASAVLIAALSLGACAALPRVALPQMPKFSLPHFSASKLAGPEKLPPGVWVQARSDLKPDPDFRFGTLPNGMRYVLRRQTLPPGQAALRLRIDAGSLMERLPRKTFGVALMETRPVRPARPLEAKRESIA